MTQEESDINESKNELIRVCKHDPINSDGRVICKICECYFAAILLPVITKVIPIVDEEYDASRDI